MLSKAQEPQYPLTDPTFDILLGDAYPSGNGLTSVQVAAAMQNAIGNGVAVTIAGQSGIAPTWNLVPGRGLGMITDGDRYITFQFSRNNQPNLEAYLEIEIIQDITKINLFPAIGLVFPAGARVNLGIGGNTLTMVVQRSDGAVTTNLYSKTLPAGAAGRLLARMWLSCKGQSIHFEAQVDGLNGWHTGGPQSVFNSQLAIGTKAFSLYLENAVTTSGAVGFYLRRLAINYLKGDLA